MKTHLSDGNGKTLCGLELWKSNIVTIRDSADCYACIKKYDEIGGLYLKITNELEEKDGD